MIPKNNNANKNLSKKLIFFITLKLERDTMSITLKQAVLLRDSTLISQKCTEDDYSWGKYLNDAFHNNDHLIIEAISKSSVCNLNFLFELALLNGNFYYANIYRTKIRQQPHITQFEIYMKHKNSFIIEERHIDGYYNRKLFEQQHIKCNIEQLTTFIQNEN